MSAAIREVIGLAILADLRDPRVADVTVVGVEVSPDLRTAKVHVSVMGDEAKQKLCLHGLTSSAGFLQHKLSERIETRYTPRLTFVLDQGVKKSLEVARILREVLPPSSEDSSSEDPESESPETADSQAANSQAADFQANDEDEPPP
jgi:ribosome-binding factor A